MKIEFLWCDGALYLLYTPLPRWRQERLDEIEIYYRLFRNSKKRETYFLGCWSAYLRHNKAWMVTIHFLKTRTHAALSEEKSSFEIQFIYHNFVFLYLCGHSVQVTNSFMMIRHPRSKVQEGGQGHAEADPMLMKRCSRWNPRVASDAACSRCFAPDSNWDSTLLICIFFRNFFFFGFKKYQLTVMGVVMWWCEADVKRAPTVFVQM